MTATSTRDATARAHRKSAPTHVAGVWAAAVGILTVLIRLAMLNRSFDLFGDEVIYNDVGRSVLSGGFPRYGGNIFVLHGPAFFYTEAGWAHLLSAPHTVMGWIYQMRALNALFAAATAAVLVLLGARAASLRAGIAAGLLFALEPFCIRQNDRVFLETSMMLWVLLGYLVFIPLVESPSRSHGRLRAVAAGVLFGCAVLTKDEGAILAVIPLLAAAVLRCGPRWSLTLLTVATTVASYAVYVAVIAANGHIGTFFQIKTSGIRRMLGLIQVTGFHSGRGLSLQARLLGEANYFATTYLILILAVPALVIVIRRGGQVPRLLGLVYCAAALALGYAVILGTLEEQELYLLVVPSVLIITVAAELLLSTQPSRGRGAPARRSRWAAAAAAVLAVGIGVNLATGAQWLWRPDDGFARLLSYMAVNVPPGASVTDAAVGQSGDVGENTLADYGYRVGSWVTSADRARNRVRYVLVPWAEVNQGYSYLSPAQVRRLVGPGTLVFSFRGRTFGDLALYRLSPPPPVNRHGTGSSR